MYNSIDLALRNLTMFTGIIFTLATGIPAAGQTVQTITLDQATVGATFGGLATPLSPSDVASSYSAIKVEDRKEIIDLLFKPYYGASLLSEPGVVDDKGTGDLSVPTGPIDSFTCEIDIVHQINQNFIQSGVTKDIVRDCIASEPSSPGAASDALIQVTAGPNGFYQIMPSLWGIAHVAQFIHPGWRMIASACGELAGGGSFLSAVAPSVRDYAIVAETGGATAVQRVSFKIVHGFSSAKKLYVWRSMPNDVFDRDEVIFSGGKGFVIDLQPNTVYSITTTLGQNKGGS